VRVYRDKNILQHIMEDQIKQILGFLTNPKLEVQTQALSIIQSLSSDEANIEALQSCNVVKEVAKLLYHDKLSQPANLTILTMSQHQEFVEQMVECKAFNAFLDIIFNVMKCLTEKDLAINKQILVENNEIKKPKDINSTEFEYKTLVINTTDKLKEGEVISVVNQENLRFSILNISNMCCFSESTMNLLLEGEGPQDWKANHFHTLLQWYLNNNIETLFSDFAYIITTLSVDPRIRSFMANDINKLEDRIKKNLIHENHKIRQNTVKAIRNLVFEHDDEMFAKRFATFNDTELHMYDLLPKAMYICAKAEGKVKPEDLEKISKLIGKYWVTVPTNSKENNLDISYKEEMELLVEIVMVTTNVEFSKYVDFMLADKKSVDIMLRVMDIMRKYVSPAVGDKIDVIIQ